MRLAGIAGGLHKRRSVAWLMTVQLVTGHASCIYWTALHQTPASLHTYVCTEAAAASEREEGRL